jgi:hypothetical protein
MTTSTQAEISGGLGIQILPYGEKKWAVIELQIIGSSLTVKSDMMELRGDCSVMGHYSGRQSIRMETEAHRGELYVFDDFDSLDSWLKTRCNKLWPRCSYCNLRYTGNEVVCSGCGGPRGE